MAKFDVDADFMLQVWFSGCKVKAQIVKVSGPDRDGRIEVEIEGPDVPQCERVVPIMTASLTGELVPGKQYQIEFRPVDPPITLTKRKD